MRCIQVIFSALCVTLTISSARAAEHRADSDGVFQSSFGPIAFHLFVPKAASKKSRLVIALHGCKQDADAMAELSRLNSFAEKRNLYVLYPEQSVFANVDHCWNWFLPENQRRAVGEPAMIMELARFVRERYSIEENDVFVIGFSAGAALAATLASCYPDMITAVAQHSGTQYAAAEDIFEAATTLPTGSTRDPAERGRKAAKCYFSKRASLRVPAIIFHGSSDRRVSPIHADQSEEQILQTHDLWDNKKDDGSVPEKTKKTEVKPTKKPRLLGNQPLRYEGCCRA
jgi:poly(hydroxyalkanoate) depolymerase family esterase